MAEVDLFMKTGSVNLSERVDLVHGASEIVRHQEGYSFYRMTKQLDKFYSYSEAANIRARCLAGVRICFHTNSGFIGLRLKYGRSARQVYAVDILVDDRNCLTFSPGENKDNFSIEMDLEPGEHKIEIHFPHVSECILRELTIESTAWIKPVKYNNGRIIFIGDSITQGMDATSPMRTYAAITAAACRLDFHNIGVGGAVMEKEVGNLALCLSWRKAVVAFGVNDCSRERPLEEFTEHARGMFEILCSSSRAMVFAVTPIPWLSEKGLGLRRYREAIWNAAAGFQRVKVIDGFDLVPANAQYFSDNLHPNDLGMKTYAENLVRHLINN